MIARMVEVNDMYECSFKYSEEYSLSELTSGTGTMCTILGDYCSRAYCPLRSASEIHVIWAVKE